MLVMYLELTREELIEKYPYVFAWGLYVGSMDTWILHQLRSAYVENAHPRAMFKREDKIWRLCLDNDENKPRLDKYLQDYYKKNSVELYPINPVDPLVTLYQYKNEIKGFSLRKDFKEWIEKTSLFNAIINDPVGTKIQAQDHSITLDLTKKITKAEDLPVELIKEFYINSPFFQNTKEGTNQPQLEYGSERTS